MPLIDNGEWVLYAWDRTLPVHAWTSQDRGTDLARLMTDMLRWRDQGQQVRLDWVAVEPPAMGPDDFKIGTRHQRHELEG